MATGLLTIPPSEMGSESSPIKSGQVCDFSSVQFSSVIQSCPTLCKSMNRSTPGLPVHHQLPEFLCCPLLLLPLIPPSIRVFPMSQLFARGGQSICDLLVTNRMGQTEAWRLLRLGQQRWHCLVHWDAHSWIPGVSQKMCNSPEAAIVLASPGHLEEPHMGFLVHSTSWGPSWQPSSTGRCGGKDAFLLTQSQT